jgi:uncharacterized protein (TIGR00299 family) protein
MFLSALAGLADAFDDIKDLPALLHLEKEAEIVITEVEKNAIACKHVRVVDKHHEHRHKPGHEHHNHRHLEDVYKIIDAAELTDGAREIARDIFLRLAKAEAHVHGTEIEKVHFHEVGAIDSLIDMIGAAWLIDRLGITKTFSTPVTTGYGFVHTQHGKLPVPAPATQILLHGMVTVPGDHEGEMCTPTGAAILGCLSPEFHIPALREIRTSYGPGEKDFGIPNTLRLSLCEPATAGGKIMMIQTNIDDMSGELLGSEFQEKLQESGAVDFYLEQVIMKKGRPGVVLNVLVPEGKLDDAINMILQQTSTIGVRYFPVERMELERRAREVHTEFGAVKIKEVKMPGGRWRYKPESSELFRIASQQDLSPEEVYKKIVRSIEEGKE